MHTLVENNTTRILTAARERPGQTRDELAQSLVIKPRSLATKIAEMKRNGVVEERGGLIYAVAPLDLTSDHQMFKREQIEHAIVKPKRRLGWLGFATICLVAGTISYLAGRYL